MQMPTVGSRATDDLFVTGLENTCIDVVATCSLNILKGIFEGHASQWQVI